MDLTSEVNKLEDKRKIPVTGWKFSWLGGTAMDLESGGPRIKPLALLLTSYLTIFEL